MALAVFGGLAGCTHSGTGVSRSGFRPVGTATRRATVRTAPGIGRWPVRSIPSSHRRGSRGVSGRRPIASSHKPFAFTYQQGGVPLVNGPRGWPLGPGLRLSRRMGPPFTGWSGQRVGTTVSTLCCQSKTWPRSRPIRKRLTRGVPSRLSSRRLDSLCVGRAI